VPVDPSGPPVVGRAVHSEHPARVRDCRTGRQVEQLQPKAVDHVIIGHAAHLAGVLVGPDQREPHPPQTQTRPDPGAIRPATVSLHLRESPL
jgi:hypothetical protein